MPHNTIGTSSQQTNEPRMNLMVPAKAPRGHGHGHGRKNKTKLVPVSPLVKKAKRPLNSWIAFRTFYQLCFASLQQKEISTFMAKVWQHDPFKGKWAIIAKSYSVLRDSLGKENAPLDKFLAISCSLMAIIEPTQYFVIMGWEIVTAENGEPFMRRNENPIDARLFSNTLSVNDVICHSYYEGYFTGDLSKVLLSENEAAMAMATTTQPTSNDTNPLPVVTEAHHDNSELTDYPDAEGLENEDGVLDMEDSAEDATAEADPASSTHEVTQEITTETDTHEAELVTEDAEKSIMKSPNPFEVSMTDAIVGPAVNPLKGDAVEFMNGHYDMEGEYPFNEEFDPNKPATVSFDPFMGNQFDPFDISDWNEFVDFDQYP